MQETGNSQDDWVDTDEEIDTTQENTNKNDSFTKEELLILWKDTLDLKAIVFKKLEPDYSDKSFAALTQTMAIQILLEKYPEIKWTEEDRKTYHEALSVLMLAFDKNLDFEEVPKTLEEVKSIAGKVLEMGLPLFEL